MSLLRVGMNLMAYSLGLLIFWFVLFAPIGLALHWLVLGASARVQAAALAPVTGIATAIIFFGSLRQAGIAVGSNAVATLVVFATIAALVAQWRRGTAWRSKALLGAASLLALSAIVLGSATFKTPIGAGPLGYGTSDAAVESVATMDAAAGHRKSEPPVVRQARQTAGERYTGFEQFAGFTIASGSATGLSSSTPTSQVARTTWTGYTLHSLIAGLLAALTALPLFVLARWRGIRLFGLLALLALGVTTPLVFINVSLGNGALVASVPFVVTGIAALLLARRDRGWYAIGAINVGASVVMVGPVPLVAVAITGLTWTLVARRIHEHLSHVEVPLDDKVRPLTAGALAVMLTLYAIAGPLSSGAGIPGDAWSRSLGESLTAWPWAWLSPLLSVTGFGWHSQAHAVPWALGPILLGIAVWRARRERDRRDLALVIGLVAAALACLAIAPFSAATSREFIETTWLYASPLLALVIVHTVGSLRASASDSVQQRSLRAAPLLAISLFAVFSIAATTTTSLRSVHAPNLNTIDQPGNKGRVLLAAGDHWLDLLLAGDRTNGTNVDADQIAKSGSPYSKLSIVYTPPALLSLTNSPVGSDPSLMFSISGLLPSYPLRFFTNQTAALGGGLLATQRVPLRHDPVEDLHSNDPAKVGGILLPENDYATCGLQSTQTCLIPKPDELGNCQPGDLPSMIKLTNDKPASPVDTKAATAKTNPRSAVAPAPFPPKLTGIACIDVPIDAHANLLDIHVRNVGIVLPADTAEISSPQANQVKLKKSKRRSPILGGGRIITSQRDTEITYGNSRLGSSYDLVLEGDLGAGVRLRADAGTSHAETTLTTTTDSFTRTLSGASVFNNVHVYNDTGTRISLGRLFARPYDLAPSCDLLLKPEDNSSTQLVQSETDATTMAKLTYPALAALVNGTPTYGGQRYAHVVIGSHLLSGAAAPSTSTAATGTSTNASDTGATTSGFAIVRGSSTGSALPMRVLIDWTEQFTSQATQNSCGAFDAAQAPAANTKSVSAVIN